MSACHDELSRRLLEHLDTLLCPAGAVVAATDLLSAETAAAAAAVGEEGKQAVKANTKVTCQQI